VAREGVSTEAELTPEDRQWLDFACSETTHADIRREAAREALAEVRREVEGLQPVHEGDESPSNWYFDGFEEAQDAVLSILERLAAK